MLSRASVKVFSPTRTSGRRHLSLTVLTAKVSLSLTSTLGRSGPSRRKSTLIVDSPAWKFDLIGRVYVTKGRFSFGFLGTNGMNLGPSKVRSVSFRTCSTFDLDISASMSMSLLPLWASTGRNSWAADPPFRISSPDVLCN